MSNGPLPSERCLLSTLCNKQIGDKVRFLGCIQGAFARPTCNDEARGPTSRVVAVTGYSAHHARVTLKHSYPKENSHVEALVDVKLLLETLKAEQTDPGQWVHVIGYLTFVDPASPATAADSRHSSTSTTATTTRVGVQALFLWIARGLDLGTYEKSMLATAN
ncbi:CST complex subunit Ten1 [Xylaria telfairii]|nr:CST complex subunit Ten1 [Xylaria telfairii]